MQVEELQQKKKQLEKAIQDCISRFIEDTKRDRLTIKITKYDYIGSNCVYNVNVTVEL